MALEVFAYLLAVHPHGRGDNRDMPDAPCSSYGSPPRAWGQLVGFSACRRRGRFTPTGVGTMARLVARRMALPVHPHGRGDNGRANRGRTYFGGSPPRAWGQSLQSLADRLVARFTPTGVGTIGISAPPHQRTTVHPHGRGDNLVAAAAEGVNTGSPPRAWGQSDCGGAVDLGERFTPTGVGTIFRTYEYAQSVTVHPHGRGDNFGCIVQQFRRRGSPPRAWGQCSSQDRRAEERRFTPTGVGTILASQAF